MTRFKFLIIFIAIFATGLFSVSYVKAETKSYEDKNEIVDAVVLSIDKTDSNVFQYAGISGTDPIVGQTQTIRVEITSGNEIGKIISIDNDYTQLSVGEKFFLNHTIKSVDGSESYTVNEPNRLGALLFFTILFIVILFLFGGIQGIRGLASLIGSFALIMYVLIPGILHGYSPILVSLGTASVIIVVGSFVTHGFNRTTLSAVIGMIGTIIFTGILAEVAVHGAHLTGYASDESTYLNMNTHGVINMTGLLLGGILIGLLGILYDVAIGQAVSVEELLRANPSMHKTTLYKRAIRIGREHIGALVNTLAIAYVGVSLPLLLLFSLSGGESLKLTINQEIFATEIIRTLVGSIGLIIAVPITTLIAVFILTKAKTLPHFKHTHHH